MDDMRIIRFLIADEFPVARVGLRLVVESNPGWRVDFEAGDGLEAVRCVVEKRPDVAILGYSLPLLNGVSATASIRERAPEVEVLIYATRASDVVIREALVAGARGYLLKSDGQDHLIAAIEALIQHKPFFSAMAYEVLIKSFRSVPICGLSLLTDRERSVMRFIAAGQTNEEIARNLDIGKKAVEIDRARVMRKLNLPSAAAIVRYAIRNHIAES